MSLATTTVWEVRTTGSDSNGGGFVPGSSGTDYSQQDAAKYSFTDLVSANGTAAAPAVTSASHSFASADVGNLIHVTAGTSWTVGYYQIVSVASGAATLDRACGSAAALSSGTYAVGGALASIGELLGNAMVGQNTAWIKGDVSNYSLSASVTVPAGASGYPTMVRGYGSVREDGGHATIVPTANGPTFILNNYVYCEYLITDCNNVSRGVFNGSDTQGAEFYRCKALNLADGVGNSGFYLGNGSIVIECEVINATPAGNNCAFTSVHNGVIAIGCVVNGVFQYGWNLFGSNNTLQNCIVIGCTHFSTGEVTCNGCIAYNCGSDAFTGPVNSLLRNNIAYGNGGYGNTALTLPNVADYNAYGSNTSGNYGPGVTPGPHDVILTANPFTDPANGDFSLNDDPGGGALLKGKGYPGALPYGGTGYADIGALQHQDSGGSAPGPFPFHGTLNILPQ